MGTTRLTCRINSDAHSALERVIASRISRKGKTSSYLMELARDNSSHAIRAFNGTGKEESCTLNAPSEWLATFQNYRSKYGLYENTRFFYDALLRGLSIELDRVDPPGLSDEELAAAASGQVGTAPPAAISAEEQAPSSSTDTPHP